MADVLLSSIVGGGGEKTPATVVGLFDTGQLSNIISNNVSVAGLNSTLSGALTANTYKNVVSVAAPGRLLVAAAYRNNTTSRSVGLRITLDGVVFYDVFDLVNTSLGRGPVGSGITVPTGFNMSNYHFNTLSVDIKSSLTETDGIRFAILYTLDQ